MFKNALRRSVESVGCTGRVGRLSAMSVAALLAGASSASAQQILETYGTSLTSYLYGGATVGQLVSPRFDQRGVGLDGGMRAGSTQGWSLAGNAIGEGNLSPDRLGPINLATGTYNPTDVDLALPAPGRSRWVVGRTWNYRQEVSGSHIDSDGYQGKNWFQTSQPEIVLFSGATKDLDVLYIVYGADRYLEFKRASLSSNEFKGKNGAAGIVRYVSGSPDTYVYYDQEGNATTFFGFNTTSNNADGQFWKIADPAGNTAYVGDSSSASTAASSGYSAKKITTAYDGADNGGRRYTYTYTVIDSVRRLTQVKAETKTSGAWSSPSGVAEVGRVEYEYYTGNSSNGNNGNLKLVTITTPLSPSATDLVKRTYYRYYLGPHSGGDPGYADALKMVLDAEGTRSYDYQDSTFDQDYAADSDASIKPYASAFFEYENATTRRISTAFFNGQCGCGGGTNGTYVLTYGDSGSYSTYIGNASYDTGWAKRTVVQRPDGTWETHYFDEVAQPLSKAITDADPAGGSVTKYWMTDVVRNSDGQVTEIRSPKNITAYTHATGSFTPDGMAGLITVFDRKASSNTKGFVDSVRWRQGTGGTTYYSKWLTYLDKSKTIVSETVIKPVVTEMSPYRLDQDVTTSIGTDGTHYNKTALSNTMHSTGAELALKQRDVTSPSVTTGNNGSGSTTTSKQYSRQDGTTAFTVDQNGIFSYTGLDGKGLVATRIVDSQTNHASDFGSDDPSGVWGVSETGSGLHIKTTYSYDAQGRLDTSTAPSGRVTKNYYTRLKDHRMVALSIPRYTTIGGDTYFGPVGYTVTNHAGRVEFQGTIGITSSGIGTALSGWIDTTTADPIAALLVGSLGSMSTSTYADAGTKLSESRVYFDIPGSGVGSAGTNYDPTFYGYDVMGRRWRVKSADGTITRTVFDVLGRPVQTLTGTNDYNYSGGETSGTDNMVQTSETVYDGGGDKANSLVSSRSLDADGNWGTSGDRRTTTYTYDGRNRAVVIENPQAPHVVTKYDSAGRVIATGLYSSPSGLSASTDPTSTATNRMGLSETYYDERGMVWKTVRHKIDDADGSDDDTLLTLTWYDAVGRVVKVDGEQLTKTTYDRIGRATNQFMLASDDDSTYAHAADVSGDYVLEESQTYYVDTGQGAGNAYSRVQISRHYNDTSTVAALDGDTDLSLVDYTTGGGKIAGRAQITAYYYDAWDRLTDTVALGTFGGSNYDRDSYSSVPSRSDTELVTTSAYDDFGRVYEVTDPRGLRTQTEFDDAGRRVTSIANYVNGTPSGITGDDDVHTQYRYDDGHLVKMWVDFDGDDVEDAGVDQVTVYTYGVSKGVSAGDSNISAGGLLQKVTYPDSGGSSDVVTFAYNALGQEMWKKDQAGNVIETSYDTAGRIAHKRATTIQTGAGYDDAVKRITLAYDPLGRTSTVTQYDNATVGSGSITDEVKYTYEDWGNIEKIEQDRDGAVTGGGNQYEVSYAYAKAGTAGRNTIRRSTVTLPGSVTYTYDYSDPIAPVDLFDSSSRVRQVKFSSTALATYRYNGVAQVISTYLEEPDSYYSLDGTTAGTYTDLDRFNRVLGSTWTKDLATDKDFYSVSISYDRNSNITDITDNVLKAGVAGNRNFDVKYDIDNLNRVTKADEGTFSGGSISNRARQQQWTLDQVGNWGRDKIDLNGDNDFVDGGGELDDTRVHNVANEMTTRDTDSNASVNYTLTHDAVGNMTDDGMSYKFVYDVWGRLRMIKDQSNNLVEEYRYNGLNQRLSWHYDTDVDGDCDGSDKTYYFAYDDQWRVVATFRESDSSAKERFLFHAAGLNGYGGAYGGIGGYIDHLIFRDKDANTAWDTASDGTLEERRYYCQNWRADVSAVVTSAGKLVEWIKYSAYGVPFALPAGDTDSDGDWDLTDLGNLAGGYELRKDPELDGDVDGNDATYAIGIAGGYQALGRGVLSSSAIANRHGYAGYENDGAISRFWHVRNRVLDSTLGRWTRRDPIGYVDGMGLYGYVSARALIALDAQGLHAASCGGGVCGADVTPGVDPSSQCPPGWVYDSVNRICRQVHPWTSDCARQASSLTGCLYCCSQAGAPPKPPPSNTPVPLDYDPLRDFWELVPWFDRKILNGSTRSASAVSGAQATCLAECWQRFNPGGPLPEPWRPGTPASGYTPPTPSTCMLITDDCTDPQVDRVSCLACCERNAVARRGCLDLWAYYQTNSCNRQPDSLVRRICLEEVERSLRLYRRAIDDMEQTCKTQCRNTPRDPFPPDPSKR